MNDDNDLRRLFDDAVSEVTPERTLDDLRSHITKVDPMSRRWLLPSLAAAAAMILVIGGAFWATRDADPRQGSSDVAATPTTPVEATIYYLGDGSRDPRLFAEKHLITPGIGGIGLAAAEEAISGAPLDGDYRTEWGAGTRLDSVTFQDDLITVGFADGSLASRAPGMDPLEAQVSINALVRTVQAAYNTDAEVLFTFAGSPAPVVLGINTREPSNGGDDEDVLALVSIDNLPDGTVVEPGKLTVTGTAAAFEANVGWEILVGGDAVVDSGFATAEECCRLAPFTFTTNISLEGPGTYTLVVHDSDESGLGSSVNQDTKEIVVQ